jgi:hypothetical protein
MLVLNVRLSAPCYQSLGGFLPYRSARFFETGGFLQLTFSQLAEKIGGGLEVYIVLPTVRVY